MQTACNHLLTTNVDRVHNYEKKCYAARQSSFDQFVGFDIKNFYCDHCSRPCVQEGYSERKLQK